MSRGRLEERLEILRQLRVSTPDDAAVSLLGSSLGDRSNLIVAEAAKMVAKLRLRHLIPDLLSALDPLFKDPVKRDPKCRGKTAIIKALIELDYEDAQPFVRGSEHVQMEPVWGGQEDAAAELRGTSILGLIACTDLSRHMILKRLVDALSDAAHPVRTDAARALEQMKGDDAALVLRMKARLGDDYAPVVGHVFDALLRLEPDQAVSFVCEYLGADAPGVADEAALSLGASREPEAVGKLIEAWNEGTDRGFGGVLLRALSSSRNETAITFLLDLVRNGLGRDAELALEALAIHSETPEILEQIEEAKRVRREK